MISLLAASPTVDVYAACYDLLARLYLHGPSALRTELLPPVDSLLDGLEQVDAGWPARVSELLCRVDQSEELERAESAYLECVAVPVPGRYVPPYASVYLNDGMLWGNSTFEVLRMYEKEGLSWERQGSGLGLGTVTAPDHIGVELAFLTLATNRSSRGRAGVERQRRLGGFLRDHCARWLPSYREALAAVGAGATLDGWTAWMVELVQADVKRRLVAVDPMP